MSFARMLLRDSSSMSERALTNVMGLVSNDLPHSVTRKKKRSGIAIPMLKTTQRKTEPLVPTIREALSSVRIVLLKSKEGRGPHAYDRVWKREGPEGPSFRIAWLQQPARCSSTSWPRHPSRLPDPSRLSPCPRCIRRGAWQPQPEPCHPPSQAA